MRARGKDPSRESEKILADVERLAGFGHYILDVRTGRWTSSEALDRIFGIGTGFLRDVDGWSLLIHPDHREEMKRYFAEEVVGRKRRFEKEYRIVRPSDGEERWVVGTGQLELDEDGNVVRMLGAIQDVTERRRSELEREALLEIMQGLVSLPDPNAFLRLLHEAVSRVIYAENLFVLLKKPGSGSFEFAYFVDQHDQPPPPTSLGRSCSAYVFRKGEPVLFTEAVFDDLEARGEVKRVGTPSPSWLGAPLKRGAETIGIMAVQDYETSGRYSEHDKAFLASVAAQVAVALERKWAEDEVRRLNADLEGRVQARTAELEAALREMEAFSYSVAHDLRAPIRAIHGFNTILTEDYGAALDDEGRRLLETVGRSARRMGLLIDDLLDFSRTGRTEMRTSCVEMTETARLVLDEAVSIHERSRYTVRVAALPPAEADPNLVEVVFRNLFSNAVKFSAGREHPVVEVGSREADGVAAYYVKDNGVGFDQKYVGKLFGIFQRLHAMDEFVGTGIGLALVKRIVERHGGRVWAKGEPDRGATFWFTLGPAFTDRGSPGPS